MRLNDYVEWTKNTSAKLPLSEDEYHMIFGMITEVGELTDVFKKDLAYKKEVDWTNVQEEIGDLMWYIAGFCRINGFNLEKILEKNVAKLEARYPEKFTEYHAKNRDLENERKILERKEREEAGWELEGDK